MLEYGIAQTDQDLEQILALQKANLPSAVSETEAKIEGFVTVDHHFDLLKQMNSPYPHIIAKAAGIVVGYALVMLRSLSKDIPVLIPMFKEINQINYQSKT